MASVGKYSKTVLAGGGPADHIPEFLQESPSMAYVENGRFYQQDVISKALPYELITRTGLSGTGSATVVGFGERADKLVGLDRNGNIYQWAEGDSEWSVTASNCIPTKNELRARQYGAGARRGDFLSTTDGYNIFVWETAEVTVTYGSEDSPPSLSMHVVVYDPAGRLVLSEDYAGYSAPRLVQSTVDSVAFLFFLRVAGGTKDVFRVSINTSTPAIGTATSVIGGLESDIPWFSSAQTNFPSTNPISGRGDDTQWRSAWRSSYMWDGGDTGWYDVAFSPDGNYGAVIYADGSGNVKYYRLNLLGVAPGSAVTVETASGTTVGVPIAISISNSQYICTISYTYDTSTNAAIRKVALRNASDVTQRSDTASVANDGVLINGTAYPDSGTTFVWATTESPKVPWIMRSSTEVPVIRWGTITSSALTGHGILEQHRIVSKGVFDDETDQPEGISLVVQQWLGPIDPDGEGGGKNIQVPTPVWNKPVTSVLVRLVTDAAADDNIYKIISTFDAAQSLAINGSSQEQDIFLPRLERDSGTDGEYRFCNRVVVEPEDIGFRWVYDDGVTPGDPYPPTATEDGEAKRKCILGVASSEFRVYAAVLDAPLEAHNYGETLLFNGGCPLMWDGQFLMEAFPFDPIEVQYISGQNTAANHMQYRVTHATLPEWKQVQLVTGFVDASGAIHRAAPSIPLWVEGLNAEEADEVGDILTFNRPLSACNSAVRYFVEVYIGIGAADPQRVFAGPLSTTFSGFSSTPYAVYTARTRAALDTLDPIRQSKTIYTAGGYLSADTFPDYKDFTLGPNRLFAISGSENGTIFFSKLFEANIFPEFNGTFVIELGQNRILTAIETLDEKTIAFTEDEIFVISNSGPDNTGSNGDFFVDKLQTTVGCSDPDSVIRTPDGLFFFSPQTHTFYLLTRDLQLIDVGQGVQDLTKDITDIRGAVLYAAENEVRWYFAGTVASWNGEDPNTDAGTPARPPRPRHQYALPAAYGALVYNYEYKRWSVNTVPVAARRVCLFNDAPAYMGTFWYPYVQRSWDDDVLSGLDVDQTLKIRTPWQRTQSLQSFGRFDEISLLGKYLSSWTKNGSGELAAGDMQVGLFYDYEAGETGTDVYRYRANVPGDFGTNRMQVSASPGRQKAQALQIEIVETATDKLDEDEPDYTFGRGFAIQGIDIVYQPKRGLGTKSQPQGASK